MTKFWICSLCWVASKQLPQALQHLTSGKHALNYIVSSYLPSLIFFGLSLFQLQEDNYQDVKPVAKDIKTLTEELLRLSHEIIEEHGGLQKVKVALVKPGRASNFSGFMAVVNFTATV